jgi:hypothetical protein
MLSGPRSGKMLSWSANLVQRCCLAHGAAAQRAHGECCARLGLKCGQGGVSRAQAAQGAQAQALAGAAQASRLLCAPFIIRACML